MRRSSLCGQSFQVLVAVAAVFLLGCGDGSSEPTVVPTVVPTATQAVAPTATLTVEEEVGEAYLRYWDVYSDAVFNLDENALGQVMTGPQLQRTLDEIDALRIRGRAAKIDVEHNFFVVEVDATAGTATVRDDYTNRSYEVDPETREMVGEPAAGVVIRDTFLLTREEGTWKVRDGVRQSDQ